MALAVDVVPLFLRMDANILALTTRFLLQGWNGKRFVRMLFEGCLWKSQMGLIFLMS